MRSPRQTGRTARGHGERASVLVAVLVVTCALGGVAAVAALAGYTNVRTATNLRAAARARANAETSIYEALYRLSIPDTSPAAIVPTLTDPDWNLAVHFTFGDTDASDGVVSTILDPVDWSPYHDAAVPAVTLEFKRDADGRTIFYNRALPDPAQSFLPVALPAPVGPLVGTVYELLCHVPSILGVQIGGVLGLCPPSVSGGTGYPVVQLRATGLDARGARREVMAEVARTLAFTPLAPLSAGGAVDLNDGGFVDGVNHHPGIHLTGAAGAAAVYGDDAAETTNSMALLGALPIAIRDSPDDHNLWLGGPLLFGPLWHGIANASLVLHFAFDPLYTSFPRPFNKQLAPTDITSAWVGVGQLTDVLTSSLTLPTHAIVPPAQLGVWTGINFGYASAIALSSTATAVRAPVPPPGNDVLWNRGVFSWRINDKNDASFPGSVSFAAATPAPGATVECGPAVIGQPPPLVCRPAALATFPQLRTYLGIAEDTFERLLAEPNTARADLDAGEPPLGFTFVDGDYTLASSTPSPGTNDFSMLYVRGNLTVQGRHTMKGVLFVDGNVTIAAGAQLTVLGAVMVRNGYTHVGTGRSNLVYSREAALRGLAHCRPWRILSWLDAAVHDGS